MTSRENTSDIMNTRLFLLSASWSMVNDVLQAGGPRFFFIMLGFFFIFFSAPPPLHFCRSRPRPFSKSSVDACLIARNLSLYMLFKIFRFIPFYYQCYQHFERSRVKIKRPHKIHVYKFKKHIIDTSCEFYFCEWALLAIMHRLFIICLSVCCFASRSRKCRAYGDDTFAGGGLQNLARVPHKKIFSCT